MCLFPHRDDVHRRLRRCVLRNGAGPNVPRLLPPRRIGESLLFSNGRFSLYSLSGTFTSS